MFSYCPCCFLQNTNNKMKSNINRTFKMKRDFDCASLSAGFAPLKCAVEKARLEKSCLLNYKEGFCKSCAEEHQKILLSRPIHNKENSQVTQRLDEGICEMEAMESSKLNEDSGYSSMLSSHYADAIEHEDSLPLAGNLCGTPKHCLMKNQNQEQFSKKTLLPVIHYEEVICSTLKKTGKRNLKSWAAVDRIVSRGRFELCNLIGKKMGLDRIDILAELFQKNLKHILGNILRHLSEMDLVNFAKVSTTWQKILQEDRRIFQMYNRAVENLSVSFCIEPPVFFSYSGCPPMLKRSQKNNIRKYLGSAARNLKNTESLKACHRCGSPAKYDPYLQRAMCNRESCGFDFCTKCLCSYHSSSDCVSSRPVKHNSAPGPLPGTKKSKQNLKRL
uniref:F-box protein 5 n=1 Tax=Catharus ustulatus TaxID=91951 RepID=A0A8C3U2Y4_CATUS